jgi:hypothetical protein
LGIGSGPKVLISHFKKKSRKSEINAERDRLLGLIANHGQDKDQEIQKAIAEIKNALRDNQLEKKPRKDKRNSGRKLRKSLPRSERRNKN